MGRTSNAREQILEAARRLLQQRSYSAIGVAEIAAEAGVPKGSFYYFFESKQALALAVVEEHWAAQKAVWARILDGPEAPLVRLHRLVEEAAATQQRALVDLGSVTGCLFGNLALELSNRDAPMQHRLQGIFEEQIQMVQAVIEKARADGAVTVPDAQQAARSLIAQLEGLVLFAKLRNDPAQLDALWASTLALLGAQSRPDGAPPGDS